MKPRTKLHQFFALFMAGLMFLVSSGFTIDVHYCQNKVKRISFVGKAKTCQEVADCQKACGKKNVKSCHSQKPADVENHENNGCCHNNSTYAKYNGDLPVVSFLPFQDLDFQQLIIHSFSTNVTSSIINTEKPTFANYWPPPIMRDISVLLHRFLC